MRNKGLVFEEMRRARRSLGKGRGVPWTEVVIGITLIAFAAAISMLR